jgi:hypothetical protein
MQKMLSWSFVMYGACMSKPFDLKKHGKLLIPREASKYLIDRYGVNRGPSRLAQLRAKGGGPKFVRIGRGIYYSAFFLDEWIQSEAQVMRHTLVSGRAS